MMYRSSAFFAFVGMVGLTACGGGDPGDARQAPAGADAPAAQAPSGADAPGGNGDGVTIPDPMSPIAPAPGTVPAAPGQPAASGPASPATPGQGTAGPGTAAGGHGATTPGAPAASPEPSSPGIAANDILERAERTYGQIRSMEADFVQQVYVPLLQSTQDSRGRIFSRMPDRFLMRFSDPQGDVIVADGRYVWMYYPSTDDRQVMRTSLGGAGQPFDLHREFLSDATRRYTAVRTGSETVGGRQTHALTLTPRTPSPYTRIRLWVDAQDNLVRQFEIVEQNETVRRLQLSNLRTNVTLGDDLFRFTPPPGAQVFEP